MRIGLDEVDARLEKQQMNFGYINTFYLSKDKDHTIVRFLLEDVKDIELYSVHRVKMTSKAGKEYAVEVSCHGDNCPLCQEALKYDKQAFPKVSKARDNIYLPLIRLYDAKGNLDPSYQVFVRSTRYYRDTFAGFAARYDLGGYTEIERIGEGLKTTYNLYNVTKDFDGKPLDSGMTIAELKKDYDVKEDDIFGRRDSLIKDWTAEQFAEYLETGTYPSDGDADESEEKEEVTPRSRTSKHGF